LRQRFALLVEVVFGNALIVLPIAKHFVSDELGRPNGFLYGGVLSLMGFYFVLNDEHLSSSPQLNLFERKGV
jgi:hypothetical protein